MRYEKRIAVQWSISRQMPAMGRETIGTDSGTDGSSHTL
jgi:hypothetical protein